METLSIGTLVTCKTRFLSTGTNVTLLSALLSAASSLLLHESSWLAVATPVILSPFANRFEEDMVKDGYEDIMNVDISSVAIEMMQTKYASVPQLKYMQMDVRDMSYFEDDSFDTIIDKGTLDSLMCGSDALLSASRMLGEVSRLIKPGGTYFLITYGDPKVRMPHLTRSAYNWKISLYIIPRPGFKRPESCSSSAKSCMEAIPITSEGMLPHDYVLEDPDSHFIYICKKKDEDEEAQLPSYPLMEDVL
ncbi:putative protein [Arabidopsis thaliana]|uniref:Uncharacterized protein T4C21_320 n=1 Tax=Arabidopsis thaliana TaxID=3702 RepID=Q9LZX3_ARATH|nr:putative protein [Arabidopsis thaliana]